MPDIWGRIFMCQEVAYARRKNHASHFVLKMQNQSNFMLKIQNIEDSHGVNMKRGYFTGASDHIAPFGEPCLVSGVHFASVKQLYIFLEKTTLVIICKKIKIPSFLLENRGFFTKTTLQLFSMI